MVSAWPPAWVAVPPPTPPSTAAPVVVVQDRGYGTCWPTGENCFFPGWTLCRFQHPDLDIQPAKHRRLGNEPCSLDIVVTNLFL